MTAATRQQTVVCDACVLINLLIAEQGSLLRNLKGYSFVATDIVIDEVRSEKLARELKAWLAKGILKNVALMQDKERSLLPVLSQVLDEGEASSLALAAGRGWLWATDEGGIAQILGEKHLGSGCTLGTVWLIREGIRQDLMTVAAADAIKAKLEKHSFKTNFESFGDLD